MESKRFYVIRNYNIFSGWSYAKWNEEYDLVEWRANWYEATIFNNTQEALMLYMLDTYGGEKVEVEMRLKDENG